MARLLREYVGLDYGDNIIEEAARSRKDKAALRVPALLQRADVSNQNNRIYGRDILEREVTSYDKLVKQGRAGGQLDHPEASVVELQNVSHMIKEIYWEGSEVKGIVEIHPSLPKGMDALGLLEAGLKVGISSRGVGETIKDGEGHDVVDESFMLIAFDLVSEPSTHEAWLMREGKEVSADMLRKIVPKEERINRLIKEILRK